MKEYAPYYFTIYWIVVMLLTIYTFSRIRSLPGDSVIQRKDNYIPIVVFSVFYILFFGFRPVSIFFGDTVIYNSTYNMLQTYGVFDAKGTTGAGSDWVFYSFMALCSKVMDVYCFFVIVMYFYMMMMFNGCRKLDWDHGATLMLFCIGAFSFYGYSVNGIRNGVACSFVILALAGVCKGERTWPIILSFIAIGCHKSTALPLAAMLLSYYVRNPKYMFLTWGGSIILSYYYGEALSSVFSSINYDERLAQNMQSGEDVVREWGVKMEARFRWDFLIYSFLPILLGWYAIFKRKVFDETYLLLLGTYIYANAFWVIMIRGLFSNRIAYLSWFIYPIVLAYPLLNFPVFERNHSQKVAWILLAQWGFTTFILKDYF